jgi:hypothetical protein
MHSSTVCHAKHSLQNDRDSDVLAMQERILVDSEAMYDPGSQPVEFPGK